MTIIALEAVVVDSGNSKFAKGHKITILIDENGSNLG